MSINAKLLFEKLRNSLSQLTYFPKTLRLVWHSARGWSLLWLLLLTIQGLLPAAIVYLTRILVDSLVLSINSKGSWTQVQSTLVIAVIMALIMILTEFIQSALEWVRSIQGEYLKDYLRAKIHEKAASIDLAFYESPDYYDMFQRAHEQANERSLNLVENGGSMLQGSITLVAMTSMLIPYGMWLPPILLVSTLPAFYVTLRHTLRYHAWWKKSTAERRRTNYYDMVLTSEEFAAELRLFELGPYFQKEFLNLRSIIRNKQLRLLKEQSFARLGAGTLVVIISGLSMAWMAWRAIKGSITLGDLALFYQAFNRGQGLLRTLLGNTSEIYTNSLFLSTFFEFLTLKPGIKNPSKPTPIAPFVTDGVCFREVEFKYPGNEQSALRNFNLTIPAGKTVAIVGANGAGKSTILKLLCRLYDPNSGSIEIDGTDIRQFSIEEYRQILTVMLQHPVEYRTTATENISMGNKRIKATNEEIVEAARVAGAHEIISTLPNGYETMLGHWFADGRQLSGGEWQRIALARAFIRKSQILILDEPTSFMDSWAEAEWLKRFQKMVEGKTGIVITHRFTTAMKADIIHVLQAGKIVESGSHNQLLEQNGLYAQSWKIQVKTQTN